MRFVYRVCCVLLGLHFGVTPAAGKIFICDQRLRKCVRLRFVPILRLLLAVQIRKLKYQVKSLTYKSFKYNSKKIQLKLKHAGTIKGHQNELKLMTFELTKT